MAVLVPLVPVIGIVIWFIVTTYTGAAVQQVSSATSVNTENVRHLADAVHSLETWAQSSQAADVILAPIGSSSMIA